MEDDTIIVTLTKVRDRENQLNEHVMYIYIYHKSHHFILYFGRCPMYEYVSQVSPKYNYNLPPFILACFTKWQTRANSRQLAPSIIQPRQKPYNRQFTCHWISRLNFNLYATLFVQKWTIHWTSISLVVTTPDLHDPHCNSKSFHAAQTMLTSVINLARTQT